jgi:hypothetical protein
MTHQRHLAALASLAEAVLEAQQKPRARRLLEVELAWVERRANAGCDPLPPRRGALRVRRIIESCRDQHLAALDADDGLSVLGIGWEEVALALRRRRRERAAVSRRRCPRCEGRMELLELSEWRRVRGRTTTVRTVYRCPGCGLSTRT